MLRILLAECDSVTRRSGVSFQLLMLVVSCFCSARRRCISFSFFACWRSLHLCCASDIAARKSTHALTRAGAEFSATHSMKAWY